MGHTDSRTTRSVASPPLDVTVVIGKPLDPYAGTVYVEIDRAIVRLKNGQPFELKRSNSTTDPDYDLVLEHARPIYETLLESAETLGISKVRTGLHFVSPTIMGHYTHLLDLYTRITLDVISKVFGQSLSVYVITKLFSNDELAALRRAEPSAIFVEDEKELSRLLHIRSHPTDS